MDMEHGGMAWLGKVDELALSCPTAHATDEALLVSRLIDVLARADEAALRIVTLPLDRAKLELWVEQGAALSAVTALLGRKTGYMLSRAPDGGSMATLVIMGLDDEYSCFGETEAIALCGAVCQAMAAIMQVAPAGPSPLIH